jgi:microcystin-dependent protein
MHGSRRGLSVQWKAHFLDTRLVQRVMHGNIQHGLVLAAARRRMLRRVRGPVVARHKSILGASMNNSLDRFPRCAATLLAWAAFVTAIPASAQEKAYSSGAFVIAPAVQSGSPTTGVHEVGELWVDSSGVLWVCTGAGTPGTWAATNNAAPSAQANPVGTILAYAGQAAPAGYLMCNGQAVSRAQYASLFSIIGTTYGAGNGSTTFNVPDLRGEFLRGLDAGRGVDSGRTLGSSQPHAFQDFRLSQSERNAPGAQGVTAVYSAQTNIGYNAGGYGTASDAVLYRMVPGPGYGALVPVNANVASETRPRNLSVNYVIAF